MLGRLLRRGSLLRGLVGGLLLVLRAGLIRGSKGIAVHIVTGGGRVRGSGGRRFVLRESRGELFVSLFFVGQNLVGHDHLLAGGRCRGRWV